MSGDHHERNIYPELDDEAFTLASGVFPDGAVWLKVTDPLPPSARLMRIRAVALRDMNDFMLLAQLVEAVRHVTDVAFSHLELPWLPWARQIAIWCRETALL